MFKALYDDLYCIVSTTERTTSVQYRGANIYGLGVALIRLDASLWRYRRHPNTTLL